MRGPKHWDFVSEHKQTADGQYVYVGDYYILHGHSEAKKRLGLLWALAFVTVIGSGFINAAGLNNSFYVIIPFVAEVACVFALSWEIIRLLYNKNGEFKSYYYNKLVNNVPAASAILSAAAAVGFICSTVFLFLHGFEGKIIQCIIYLLLKTASLIIGILIYRYYKTLEWEKKEKNND